MEGKNDEALVSLARKTSVTFQSRHKSDSDSFSQEVSASPTPTLSRQADSIVPESNRELLLCLRVMADDMLEQAVLLEHLKTRVESQVLSGKGDPMETVDSLQSVAQIARQIKIAACGLQRLSISTMSDVAGSSIAGTVFPESLNATATSRALPDSPENAAMSSDSADKTPNIDRALTLAFHSEYRRKQYVDATCETDPTVVLSVEDASRLTAMHMPASPPPTPTLYSPSPDESPPSASSSTLLDTLAARQRLLAYQRERLLAQSHAAAAIHSPEVPRSNLSSQSHLVPSSSTTPPRADFSASNAQLHRMLTQMSLRVASMRRDIARPVD